MSEPTQRINTADFAGVRETHIDEQELVDLALNNLSADDEDSVRGHLNTCPACRERLKALHLEDGMGATKVRDPMVGQMLGEYRVEAALARGGMGVVYRGVQPMIGKRVAIKVLAPELDDEGGINRLLDEARAVNAIRHPNIIDIFSFGSLPDGRHYFVMELLDGQSLEDLINTRRTLSADEVMTVLEQSCSALGAAHAAGVVHRDLKPANLFLGVLADQSWHVTVLDFGLAKRLGNTRKTATNVVMGTPGYMAPEQIRAKPITAATDLYALGVVAWVLLTGSEPFQAEGIMDLLRAHIEAPLPSLRERAPDAPAGLVSLIERMLAKRPEDRPASALEVRSEVQRIRSGGRAQGPLVRRPARKANLVPAGMPSAELADAVAGTHVKTGEPPVARQPLDTAVIVRAQATPEAVEPIVAAPRAKARWPWLVGGLSLLAIAGVWFATRAPIEVQPPSTPPAPIADAPPVPLAVLEPVVVAPEPRVSPDAGAPTLEVEAPVTPRKIATVKKPDAPVDRRKRLGARLQQLEKRFSQAVAAGASVDLELAEVRGLRTGLDRRDDEGALQEIETAVQRLEKVRP